LPSPQHNQQEVHVQTTKPISNQEGRPSFLARMYELGDRFGKNKSVRPFAETSRGTTPIFQTPHIGGSLRQEAKEDL
jgi:hypothetical protein